MTRQPTFPGLCLAAEALAGPEWLARVEAALEATRAATLMLDGPDGAAIDPAAARALVQMAQRKSVATLIVDDWRTARAIGADGVHLTPRADIDDAYRAARAGLAEGSIVGADGGVSRHDAMMLGEAGADYVAFGPAGAAENGDSDSEESQVSLVGWWSDLFVVPVVAVGVETAEDAARIAAANPDFISVRLPRTDADAGPVAEWAAAILDAIGAPVATTAGARS
ncbi:thiamine phosphate synthase [Hyphomicrobium sp.]|uniref:thiamine phosphate synthase n=1 Tax=Hyphomicrobium sp. TaxID=82 RepID=UPI003F722324